MTVTEIYTVDTNILIYSIDATEKVKHSVARHLVDTLASRHVPLPIQALNELFYVVSRKKKPMLSVAQAYIHTLSSFMEIIPPSAEDLAEAMEMHRQNHQQFFDALLIATARRAGVTALFSEDTQFSSVSGTLKIINPFLLAPPELDALLA